MKYIIRAPGGKRLEIEENFIDRAIGVFSPEAARRRLTARAHMAMTGSYIGGSRTRRATKEWNPLLGDADSDTLYDLPTLRARSRDMIRNEPLATGALKTKVTHIIGTGLRLHSQIDRDILGMGEDEAAAWEALAEREWSLWWNSSNADATRHKKGPALARMIYNQVLENGDVFVQLPRITRAWSPYTLALQVIEADRVCNKDYTTDTETLTAGIERDVYGAPTFYHVLKQHPGAMRYFKGGLIWTVIPAWSSRTGLPNILHLMNATRPGQTRGVPDLAPVIETLKQLGRYTEAELMAAVVSGLFTVFIQSESGDGGLDLTNMDAETGGTASDADIKLSSGAVVGLAPGETINTANPGRPNAAFDPFWTSVVRQIGVGLNLPYEILIKHFTASYSASRAALNEAWEYFMLERDWFADDFYRAVYEVWMYEAVASGRLYAPGYYDDPLIRAAYLGSEWTGPARQPLDETKEAEAAGKRIDLGLSTHQAETAKMTGLSFDRNVVQLGKEKRAMEAAGVWVDPKPAAPTPIPAAPEPAKKEDNADETA